jgi:hypothetical protein
VTPLSRCANRISTIAFCCLKFLPSDAFNSEPLYIAPRFEGVNHDAAAKGRHDLYGFC